MKPNVMAKLSHLRVKHEEANEQGGVKFDGNKPRPDLFNYDHLNDVAKVLAFGAAKYGPDNWKLVEPERYRAAIMRHLIAYMNGEVCDPETGISHLAHATCSSMFLSWFDKQQKDDSPIAMPYPYGRT
jgi:hypothetical protein